MSKIIDTRTRAQHNKAINQDSLRDKLRAGGHLQYAVETLKKIDEATDSFEVAKHTSSFNCRMKLINKYLPELKSTELTGDQSQPLVVSQMVFPTKD